MHFYEILAMYVSVKAKNNLEFRKKNALSLPFYNEISAIPLELY